MVNYSREDEPMGTAGALRLAYRRFTVGQRVFAMNGDSILQVPFRSMYEAHLKHGPAGTIALAEVADTSRYGTVDVDENGFVSRFREKSGEERQGVINGAFTYSSAQSWTLCRQDVPCLWNVKFFRLQCRTIYWHSSLVAIS